jgi:hypothetical protein
MQRKTLEDKFAELLSDFNENAINPYEKYPFQVIAAIKEWMHYGFRYQISYKERLNGTINRVESYLNESDSFLKKLTISDQESNFICSLNNFKLKNKMQEIIEEDKKLQPIQSTAVSVVEITEIPQIPQLTQLPMWHTNAVIPQPPSYGQFNVPYNKQTNPFIQQLPVQPTFMYTNPYQTSVPIQYGRSPHILFSHPAPQPQQTYAPGYYNHQPSPGY